MQVSRLILHGAALAMFLFACFVSAAQTTEEPEAERGKLPALRPGYWSLALFVCAQRQRTMPPRGADGPR